MKEAIGGTSLFFIVIVILSVFALYVSLAINWSAAYKVKDEILFYIETNRGMNKKTLEDIKKYTKESGYAAWGECAKLGKCWKGVSVNTANGLPANDKTANFCVKRTTYVTDSNLPERAFYDIKVFFKIDVPIISRLDITIDGETAPIYHPKDMFEYDKDCVVK
jgi:hypothetical protein